MRTLRTPDDCFADLPDFGFAPNYAEISDQDGGTLRVHYLDEGPTGGPPVLLMHGEPTWSYLYRRMIPLLVDSGRRVIAPDLVGFGRSDKPAEQADHTYRRHVAWMHELLIGHLSIERATFFGQDWGGLIGLRVVTASPDRFERLVVSNTGLPTGDQRMTGAFLDWQRFSRETPVFDVGFIVSAATNTELTDGERAAYDAPFPDDTFKAGPRMLPSLVPTSPDDPEAPANRQAWSVLEAWTKPVLTCFSDGDPVTAGGERPFQQRIPGARGQPHVTVANANHFVQEDAPEQLVQVITAPID